MLSRAFTWLAYSLLTFLNLVLFYHSSVPAFLGSDSRWGSSTSNRLYGYEVNTTAQAVHEDSPNKTAAASPSPMRGENSGPVLFSDDDALLSGLRAPKIRQATMLSWKKQSQEHAEMDERCLKTYVDYGKKWGYPTHILRNDVVGHGEWIELLFSKPLYLLSLIVTEMAKPKEQRSQWLVFFDSDTVLVNSNVQWDVFLPPEEDFSDINVVATKDWNGFNAGVFFLRVTEWTLKMLSQVVGYKMLRPEVELGPNVEQACFRHVFTHDGYREPVVYFPPEYFNTFEQSWGAMPPFDPGEILIHMSGMKGDKYAAMQGYFKTLDDTPEKLQIPYEKTFYPAAIKNFWARLKDARTMAATAKKRLDNAQPKETSKEMEELADSHANLQNAIETEADVETTVLAAIQRVAEALAKSDKSNEPGQIDVKEDP